LPEELARLHYRALGELIAHAMHDNLNRFIVPNVAGPARMVKLVDEGVHAGRIAPGAA